MADLGALRNRDAAGAYHSPFRLIRDLTLFAAGEAGIPAVDAVYTAFRDEAGLRGEAGHAADLGFSGKLAIHPAQIAPIHAAFAPDEAALAQARRIKDAFAASEGNAMSLDGEMLDMPHFRRAMRLLQRAAVT